MKCYSGESGGTEPDKKPSDNARQLGQLGKWIAILLVLLFICFLFPLIGALLLIGGVIAIPIWFAIRNATQRSDPPDADLIVREEKREPHRG